MEGAGIVRLEIVSFFAANGIVSFVVISQGKKRIGLPNRKGLQSTQSTPKCYTRICFPNNRVYGLYVDIEVRNYIFQAVSSAREVVGFQVQSPLEITCLPNLFCSFLRKLLLPKLPTLCN